MSTNNTHLINPVIEIARQASDEILKIYNAGFDVQKKEDKTPVTTADYAAHHCIVNGLQNLTPDIPVLSEESTEITFSERKHWQEFWLVDPLDGTREFIKRNGEFTVNIALIREHKAILGVILIPVSGECYFAAEGNGAFKLDDHNNAVAINVKKVDPTNILVAGSRSHADTSLQHFLSRLEDYELLSVGSSIKSCLVAEGKVDIYPRLGPTSEWDTAAAQCIVEEAGGFVTDLDLNPLRYNTRESILNPHFLVFGDNSIDWRQYL